MESIRIGKGEEDFISIDDLLEDYIYIREERDEFIYVVRDLLILSFYIFIRRNVNLFDGSFFLADFNNLEIGQVVS